MPQTSTVARRFPVSLPRNRRAAASVRVVIGLAFVVLGVFAIFVLPLLSPGKSGKTNAAMKTKVVQREDMLVTVTEEGNVGSARNIEVKCGVAGGSSILWIVEDGSQVSKGDKLVELESSALEDEIGGQRITFEQARTVKLQSEKTWAVSKIAVTEYLEGTFRQALQDSEAAVTIAAENLRTAENSLKQSEKMFRRGFVSSLDLEGAKFAVERCELELGSAQTAKDVLVNFTKEKTLEELRSLRDNAEAQLNSDIASYKLEQTRLKRMEEQLANCTILAPEDGMVVYANESSRRSQTISIEEGAALREQQVILRLPDLAEMEVKVTVHESKIAEIRVGMPARVRILDRETTGNVTSIANQPEPTNPFEGNSKVYAATVKLAEEESSKFRPGMTAEVEILIAHVHNAVTVPVTAVIERGGKYFAWVVTESGEPERRVILIGSNNESVVEVKDGVLEGETVVLNPRAVIPDARNVVGEEEADVESRFGDAPLDVS